MGCAVLQKRLALAFFINSRMLSANEVDFQFHPPPPGLAFLEIGTWKVSHNGRFVAYTQDLDGSEVGRFFAGKCLLKLGS